MNIYFLFCLISINPPPSDIVKDQVEFLELNHFHDEYGRIVFDQYLFYDKYPRTTIEYTRQWRLIRGSRETEVKDEWGLNPVYLGSPDYHLDLYNKEIAFVEGLVGENRIERRIKFRWFNETYTQIDTELENRQIIDKMERIPFSNPIGFRYNGTQLLIPTR